MSDTPNYTSTLYKAYSSEREKLHSAALEVGARYDRTVLALSGGALAISITFLEKVIPTPVPWTVFILAPGWLLLLASVITQLFALASSQYAVEKQIEWLDEEYSGYFSAEDIASAVRAGQVRPKPDNPYVNKTKNLNRASRWTLVLGLLFIFGFSACNMYLQKENTHDRREEGKCAVTRTNQGGTTASVVADRSKTGQGLVHAPQESNSPASAAEGKEVKPEVSPVLK